MREKLPFLTKFFYGFGSLAYGIKDNAFNYFLLFVYVQVFGLAPNPSRFSNIIDARN
tara:strand:+ start:176 stop:346 length:171 start_codon:yes stop_codon:yes gene_type:complete